MAYQTGTAGNIAALFEKLADFIKPLNWQVVHQSASKLYLEQLKTHKFWAIEYLPTPGKIERKDVIYIMPCSAIDKDKGALEQPGSPNQKGNAENQMETSVNLFSDGPFVSYDFIATEDYIHVVFEREARLYRHFGLGQLIKDIDFEGGEYAYGTWLYSENESRNNSNLCVYGMGQGYHIYSSVLRAEGLAGESRSPWYFCGANRADNTTAGVHFFGTNTGAMLDRSVGHTADDVLTAISNSTLGQVVMPNPNVITAHLRNDTYARLGIVPDRYHVNMYGIIPRTILTINGEKWLIIPASGYHNDLDWRVQELPDSSGRHGVAYRLVE
ncbi:hypothetical protein [Aggregatibacter actinomycetemcomitans]|uniref:hypothetical protein n=1 Tax=Aggregatibacter actinomycetemcomitans TaxID=714 RepID=UPI001E5AE3B6|nr:hypothetical protein [Aggregatibacter actinomycetemcomitans]